MSTGTQIDVMSILLFASAGVGSALIALLSWMANKMYEKLQAIEALFMENLAAVTARFHTLENRVTRVEVHIDTLLTKPRDH